MKPVHVNYYYTYTTAINTTQECHLSLPTFGLHGPQRPQPTYTTTIPILLLLLQHRNIIYAYLPSDYMGHRGHNPLILLYLYYCYYYNIGISSMPTYLQITWATEATTHTYYYYTYTLFIFHLMLYIYFKQISGLWPLWPM